MSTSNSARLVVMDDDREIVHTVAELACTAGFTSASVEQVAELVDMLHDDPPLVVALDLQMPGTDGVEVLRALSEEPCTPGILIVSGMDQRTIDAAERLGRQLGLKMLGSLRKPFAPEVFIDTLRNARRVSHRLTRDELNRAIDCDELRLHFQPVIQRLHPGAWHAESVEALVRWAHPELGLLAPGDFLPVVESVRSELMHRLTDWVLESGVRQLQVWQRRGLHLGLRVNIPAGSMTDSKFPDRLMLLLAEYEVDPVLLTLEIASVAELTASCTGMDILTRLRLKEIKLSLDGVGAPGFDLGGLYALPLTEIKLHRRLTADLVSERNASPVMGGMVDIAHSLGLVCCAEGVETAEQLAAVNDLGCDSAQGFYIGGPVAAADIPDALVDWTLASDELRN